jgi:hypothetical protein
MISQSKLNVKIEPQLNVSYALSNLRKRRRSPSNFYKKKVFNAIFLYYFDQNRQLYGDIDVSKKKSFGAFFYHVKNDSDPARAANILKKKYKTKYYKAKK